MNTVELSLWINFLIDIFLSDVMLNNWHIKCCVGSVYKAAFADDGQ